MLFGELTWFYVVHPNLDPTLGVAMGVKGVYPSMWEVKVGSGARSATESLKIPFHIVWSYWLQNQMLCQETDQNHMDGTNVTVW